MGVLVGVEVGRGVEVAVGARVSLGRGVASGAGGVLTHAARPSDRRISQDHFAIFTAHTRSRNQGFRILRGSPRIALTLPGTIFFVKESGVSVPPLHIDMIPTELGEALRHFERAVQPGVSI